LIVLKDFVQEVLETEHNIEQLKKELAKDKEFTLQAAFETFARSVQYKLSVDEFMFGLERLDIPFDEQEVHLYFNRYDADQDGRIGFWELSNSLLPVDFLLRDDVEQRQGSVPMSHPTRDLFKRILSKAI
jgi:Ca2+-binding EF-hand superfamily protein